MPHPLALAAHQHPQRRRETTTLARAPKKCARDHCETRTQSRYCDAHRPMNWNTSKRRQNRTPNERKYSAWIKQAKPQCHCTGCPKCTQHGCQRTGTELDHIVNLEAGGNDHPTNLSAKCAHCHNWKTQQEAAAARQRTK